MAPVTVIAVIGVGGLSLIKSSEGLRTAAYRDPVGIPTVCYGHTGPEVRVGQRLTVAQCDRTLLSDVAAHQAVLLPTSARNCLDRAPLTQRQLDALTSLTFNLGTDRFCRSTLAARLRARDYRNAAAEFPKWNKATVGGRLVVLPGLVKRRAAEQAMFLQRG